MGAVEEGGKAVSGYISALGTQPVLLVQSLIIGGIVFLLYMQGTNAYNERKELLKSVFDSQQNVREILSQCIVPPDDRKRTDLKSPIFKLQSDEDKVVEWPPLPRPRPIEANQ